MGSSDTAGETLKLAAVLEAVAAALATGDLSACLGAGRVPSAGGAASPPVDTVQLGWQDHAAQGSRLYSPGTGATLAVWPSSSAGL